MNRRKIKGSAHRSSAHRCSSAYGAHRWRPVTSERRVQESAAELTVAAPREEDDQVSERDRRTTNRVTVYRARGRGADEVWEVEYEAVADALHFACRDLREGRRAPLSIVEDGVLIYDREAIERACHEEDSGLGVAATERDGE